MTISNESRGRIKKVFEPIALGMGRLGLTPNGLTLIGFAITAVGAILVGAQAWVIGGIVVFVGGVFDMFDGTLARATGQASPFGAFMDSTFDKAGEILVFLGCLAALANSNVGTVPVVVAAAAMGAAIMVSYTRAKSDALGYSSGMGLAAVGIMPREVRLVIISLGIVLTGTSIGTSAIELALGVILVGSVITVIQRTLHVRSQAKSAATNQTQ
ncbi:MAG TPA: CDP-alcohol phosphatidyltransferase family protein [Candidatus Limnocylindrales bacterium]|jgi:CDP-diacylglycerol--glycerol-3-phosphate 3-phosphatidyltransferase|nr:CDP-alcohol phosphatidyltransferase family protein [Candidatus Limnocylindrales bacterium]